MLSAGFAQAPAGNIRIDSSNVKVRVPAKNALGSYRLSRDFIYDDKPEAENQDFSVWKWIRSQLRKLFQTKAMAYVFNNMKYIIIGAAALLVLFIIRKLSLTGLIYRQDKSSLSFPEGAGGDAENVNPDILIAEAVEKKEYRNAIRYCYIKALRQLEGRALIDWQLNKTNSQYLKELSNAELKKHFAKLTLVFEKTWYGGAPVQESHFAEAKQLFDAFYQAVTES